VRRETYTPLAAALSIMVACSSRREARPPDPPAAPATHAVPDGSTTAASAGTPATTSGATSAVRCSECHRSASEEWKGSAHARASTSAAYVAMRRATPGERCERCHAPVANAAAADEPLAAEGVSCDACHTMVETAARRAGGAFRLRPNDRVKFGPLCDAKVIYFHRMACAPIQEESGLCASCHLYYRSLPGGMELPVLTEFEEWASGPDGDGSMECQGCHMPGAAGEAAIGAGARSAIHHHGFLGRDDLLRTRAVTVRISAHREGDRVAGQVIVTNRGAAHRIPTGLPDHRLVLRVRAVGPGGTVLGTAEYVYGRVLVDGRGVNAPFNLAVRVASDNRLEPGERRREQFALRAPAAGSVQAEVLWREREPQLATALHVAAPREVLMASAEARVASGRTIASEGGAPATAAGRVP
jgi:hypothetical protein